MPAVASLWSRFFTSGLTLYQNRNVAPLPGPGPAKPTELYPLLRAYVENNSLYSVLSRTMRDQGIAQEALAPLRNPAARSVDFFAAHLWPGPLSDSFKIVLGAGANKAIVPAIEQVWTWSNWQARKQVAARWFAMYGDMFIKVAQTQAPDPSDSRVYLQLIDPAYVTDFETDERDFLTWVRIDTPQTVRDRPGFLTEVWDKATQLFRRWEHNEQTDTELDRLGTPTDTRPFSAFGIDFIPIVLCRFKDLGDKRGVGSFVQALDKIDEANRQATRLHQMLFRHAAGTQVLERVGFGPDGEELPPAQPVNANGRHPNPSASDGSFAVGDDRLWALPGNTKLVSMIPNIDYTAMLAILNAHMEEIEKDLPELAFARLREKSDMSGRAIRLYLADAEARVIEARYNAMQAFRRMLEMALTIGANAGLVLFRAIGRYEDGAFAHTIDFGDVFPLDASEQAEVSGVEADSIIKWQTIVGTRQALIDSGKYAPVDIERIMGEVEAEKASAADAAMQAFSRGQTGGGFGAQQQGAA